MSEKGLIIGRFQPLHKGHFSVFQKIADECDSIMIGIGSAQTQREKDNPLSGGERITMIKKTLERYDIGPYEIYPIPDIECYPAWPYYVKSLLPEFDYLYAHSPTVLRLFERTKTKIRKVEKFNKEEWSATKIRKKIRQGDEWKSLVPEEVADYLEMIDIKERLKPTIETKEETEKKVAHLLTKKEKTIATAESCTGGYIAHKLTNTPGSSAYFEEGYITYTSKSKIKNLNVKEETIEEEGVVSSKTAEEMAKNTRKKADTDIGIATTGILGPGGNHSETPIGTVFVGLADEENTYVKKLKFSGNRWDVKKQTGEKVLEWVIEYLEEIK